MNCSSESGKQKPECWTALFGTKRFVQSWPINLEAAELTARIKLSFFSDSSQGEGEGEGEDGMLNSGVRMKVGKGPRRFSVSRGSEKMQAQQGPSPISSKEECKATEARKRWEKRSTHSTHTSVLVESDIRCLLKSSAIEPFTSCGRKTVLL